MICELIGKCLNNIFYFRKTITRMASMLSHSHVKFVGDYYFAAKTEGIRLRNPTKIVWKGFNKWTK